MGGKSPTIPAPPPAPEPVEEKDPDTQINARKSRDRKRSTSGRDTGLNRFLITPGGDTGSGANVPGS